MWAIGCIFYEIVTGTKAFPLDMDTDRYEGFEDFTLPDIDFHYGRSAYFFKTVLSMTLEKEWKRRPTAENVLNLFLDFDEHLKNDTELEISTPPNSPLPPRAPSPVSKIPTSGFTLSSSATRPGTTLNINSPRFSPYPRRIRRTSSQPSLRPPLLSPHLMSPPTTSPATRLRRTASNYFPMPWSETLQCSPCREKEIEVNYFWEW